VSPAPHPVDHPGPFVLVDDPEAPALAPDAAHHLTRVLRRRAGDPLVVGDGRGRWAPAVLAGDGAVERTGPVEAAPRPPVAVTVAFALVKGDKGDLVVQKLTELGVDRIVPFRAERSVVRWDDDRAARAVARWRAVATSATEQCHRPWLPEVTEVTSLAELVAGRYGPVALADRDGAPPSLEHPGLAVGPEGGWSPAERDLPLPRVALGTHVLRAETAALTAGALLTALRDGGVGPRCT